MLKPISTVKVLPRVPAALSQLTQIAHNLRWSWDHAAIELFRRLDADLWESCGRNPVLLLGSVEQSQLEEAAHDEAFLAHMRGVAEQLEHYIQGEATWFRREHAQQKELLVAYFSAEFGITECLSIFAGGLGVLAGDHLKAASDLGIPLVGVGLLYQQGYFRQYLNAAGWQQEAFEDNDFHTLPIRLIPDVAVHIDLPDGALAVQVWCVNVGRLKLYLLDTNIPSNRPEHRNITEQLYGGDVEMRLRQEIVLGIGGYRALEALGLRPTVYHMNEGHSAFLGLERVVRLMETEKLSFQEARLLASASLIFTTHTPVAAGHDYFSGPLMDRYFGEHMRRFGIGRNDFLALGRKQPCDENEDFCMTVLALRLATASNGVSKLHGEVSRHMWNEIWNGIPEAEVPIGHVTNGVHFRTWVSFEMNQLYDRYLGPKWRRNRRITSFGNVSSRFPHRNCGERMSGAARGWLPTREKGCGNNCRAQRAAIRAGRSRGSAEPGCADHRVRAAVRDIQTRHADFARPGAAGQDSQQSRAASTDCVCGQGASAR